MLKSKILGYSRKTGKVPGPGEHKCQGTVYGNRITVYGHTISDILSTIYNDTSDNNDIDVSV
jgi:hypothetical protein